MTETGLPLRGRRLRSHVEFVAAQRGGRRVSTPHFILLVASQPAGRAPLPARLGLVVSKSVGSAVSRNRVKRVVRECFRTWPDLLPPGVDLVVIARSGAATLGCEQVRDEWRTVARLVMKRATEAVGAVSRPPRPPPPRAR